MRYAMILLLLFVLPSGSLADNIDYSAVVLDINGVAIVRHAGKEKHLDFGDLLYPGDVVKIAKGGGLTVHYLKSGHEEIWKDSSQFSVDTLHSVPPCQQIRKDKKVVLPRTYGAAQSGTLILRGDLSNVILVDGLSNTCTVEERPTFRWNLVSGAQRYRLSLYFETEAKPLWQETTPNVEIDYPQLRPALHLGSRYEWEIEALRGEKVIASKRSCFYLPAAADLPNLNSRIKDFKGQLLEHPEDTVARLSFIFFLERNNLYDSALEQYAVLRKQHEDSESLEKLQFKLLQVRSANCNYNAKE